MSVQNAQKTRYCDAGTIQSCRGPRPPVPQPPTCATSADTSSSGVDSEACAPITSSTTCVCRSRFSNCFSNCRAGAGRARRGGGRQERRGKSGIGSLVRKDDYDACVLYRCNSDNSSQGPWYTVPVCLRRCSTKKFLKPIPRTLPQPQPALPATSMCGALPLLACSSTPAAAAALPCPVALPLHTRTPASWCLRWSPGCLRPWPSPGS